MRDLKKKEFSYISNKKISITRGQLFHAIDKKFI